MSKSAAGQTRYTLDLSTALHKRLRIQALNEGRPASDLCRELIEEYLLDEDAQDGARLRAAYEAGVRAERERITAALRPSTPAGPGLPTSPPLRRG